MSQEQETPEIQNVIHAESMWSSQDQATEKETFILSTEQWGRIQYYIQNALLLPVTEAHLKAKLGVFDPATYAKFSGLLPVFQNMKNHATQWEGTYQQVVELGTNIAHYSRDTATTFAGMRDLADRLIDDDNPATQKKWLKMLEKYTDELLKDATVYGEKAVAANDAIKHFHKLLLEDYDALGKFNEKYDQEHNKEKLNIQGIETEIQKMQKTLEDLNRRFRALAGSAGAAGGVSLVIPFGILAVPILAGLSIKQKKEIEKEIAKVTAKYLDLSDKHRILANLSSAKDLVGSLHKQLEAALQVVSRIVGIWHLIKSDLEHIKKKIQDKLQQAGPIMKGLFVEQVIEQWNNVSAKAEKFVANAYVKFEVESVS